MLPAGWARDLLLLLSLALVGMALGSMAGARWGGLAIALLCYLTISYRRLDRVHRWLSGELSDTAPPVHGGMLGEFADRVHYLNARERRRLEQAQSALRHLRESYAALKDGVVMLGAGEVIEWCNASAVQLLSLRHPEDVGQQLVNLLRAPDFAQWLLHCDAGQSFELRLGTRVLELQATAFGSASKVLFVRDVSALRQLETMRRDFVANISHELRTPLTVISGYLDTLADAPHSDPAVLARAHAQMRQQAGRMEDLLRDLMLLSRLESASELDAGTEEWVELAPLLGTLRDNALGACNSGRAIALDCAPGLHLRGARAALQSVVSNLLFNAVRYTADGGHIRLHVASDEGGLLLEVSDDGIGIEEVHIPRLTERFFRVEHSRSADGGGTGLGLAIVKHALRRLDGELAIRSRPGEGSTFSCRFPASRCQQREVAAAQPL